MLYQSITEFFGTHGFNLVFDLKFYRKTRSHSCTPSKCHQEVSGFVMNDSRVWVIWYDPDHVALCFLNTGTERNFHTTSGL